MSDSAAGQEGPTPDFIPGWFAPREGNSDPATREAVRIPDPGDYFPITFLRPTETVRPARRPQLGFTIGKVSEPGHELFDLAVPPGYWIVRDADGAIRNWRDEDFKAKYRRSEQEWTAAVDREPEPRVYEEPTIRDVEPTAEQRDQLRYVDGWQGTPPAEGTRRRLILDTLEDLSLRLISGQGGKPTSSSCLEAADAIEEALLKVVDQGATPESGSPASVAMDVLDSFVPRTREGRILTIADRVTALADELVVHRREEVAICDLLDGLSIPRDAQEDAPRTLSLSERVYVLTERHRVEEEAKRLLADTVNAQQTVMDKLRAEGRVKSGTRELVIVLEDVSDVDQPPEYRFIELEDQDGAGVGAFPLRPSSRKPFLEITIPYGRDDAWVSEVAYQAAGAATRPLLEDHPDYVFPAERVSDAVAELLQDFGIARACRDCAEEQLTHGAKEVDGRRDDTIKSLTLRCDSLLAQRESARSGEDTFKAQRDSALHLLRWLIGDLIPPDLISLGDES